MIYHAGIGKCIALFVHAAVAGAGRFSLAVMNLTGSSIDQDGFTTIIPSMGVDIMTPNLGVVYDSSRDRIFARPLTRAAVESVMTIRVDSDDSAVLEEEYVTSAFYNTSCDLGLSSDDNTILMANGGANGYAQVYQPTVTNIEKTRYLGVADTGAGDASSVDVRIFGTDENQTGLTVGTVYYVNPTGGVSTTKGAVKIGIATGTTDLTLMGDK